MTNKSIQKENIKEFTYFVSGMHCSSCEILIERELLGQKNIKSVEAKTSKGEVTIEYEGEKPAVSSLNNIFVKDGYQFSEGKIDGAISQKNDWGLAIILAGLLILIFFLLNYLGLGSLISVNLKSSLPMFFVFGLLAGVSSCAALIGGVVLSLSKQWNEIYANKNSAIEKSQPHILFNVGRIISFGVLGGMLGFLGKTFDISFTFTSFLVLAVSVLMIVMGLQMLGIKYFQKFQFTAPKFITKYVADESNFKGRWMPAVMGALTFLLPCGFTITAQGLALISGSGLQGALIMLAFVLGTTPILLGIGLSSIQFSKSPHLANRFTKIAAVLVLFFGLFNINSQMNVLGITSINDLLSKKTVTSANENGLVPVVGGKQIIKMDASANGYQPNYFKVRTGIPVRWEITDTGTSGCTNAVISKGLFIGQISLTPGQTSVQDFTPVKPGIYKFSCWMGMVSGTIEVVDNQKSSTNSVKADSTIVSSGASGYG